MNNPDAPATKRQTWALFCITKEDYRDRGLTKREASDLIGELGNKKKKTKKPKTNHYVDLNDKAIAAGLAALKDATPTPMVVQQHANMLDDNSPVEKSWFVEGGVCGFAWINVKCRGEGLKFINALKKQGLDNWRKDGYYGGYTYWVREGGQSMERKEAYDQAFARILYEAGINAHNYSRMD